MAGDFGAVDAAVVAAAWSGNSPSFSRSREKVPDRAGPREGGGG
ncbi:hypothetical protein [Lysobacter gummosus]